MIKVELNNSNTNPFYGMKNCLKLFQNVGGIITFDMLDKAYKECNNKEKKQMFYSLLFSIGDITARQHNVFKGKKKDSGGNANREGFHTVIKWIWNNDKKQFARFLVKGIFNEYTCFDILLRNRVKTKDNKVIEVYDTMNNALYRQYIVSYLYSIIKGNNPFNKMLIAKFLTLPRLSKRQGHKKILPETRKVMEGKVELLKELSDLMGWEYDITPTICNFKGYRKWRKEYNKDLESVVFSTGAINDMDRDSFLKWFDALPAQARFRVKNRILYSKVKDSETPKYPLLQQWYNEWEKYKEDKQQEQRLLEEKVRQNQASEEDIIELQKIKKEAKVNIGATNFLELYKEICNNNIDKLKLEAFINKVNLPYNSLVIIDDSGSMTGAPFNFASFIAAVCLYKNPDDDARNLIGFFDDNSHWHTQITAKCKDTPNWLFRRALATKVNPTPFIDHKKSFYDNYISIKEFCNAVFKGGCTRVDSIAEGLHDICKKNSEVLDSLKSYPVWTIISDGYFNTMSSPEESIKYLMKQCETYFGFKPFIVCIDIMNHTLNTANIEVFSDIDNFMYIPSNPAQIEQFLTNFKNMDTFDIYTPLQSIYRSNRYELIRDNVL